jgi:hypothetical protein
VVITYSPAATEQYIGSPGIAILPDGSYLAKCELFGPGSNDEKIGVTTVFVSRDRGRSWSRLSEVPWMYWATLFMHRSALYLIGTNREYGNVVISRSTDSGRTWTSPKDGKTGLLRADGKFHGAPVPVVVHNERLWRAMEDAKGPGGWGSHFRAFMMSAPVEADLLQAASWTSSNPIARDSRWNNNDFGGWLEGNAVVTPEGRIVDVLRVAAGKRGEKAAIVTVSADGKTGSFDPATGLVPFPGGAKKFTIRWDTQTRLYWSLVNTVSAAFRAFDPGGVRNTLSLVSSPDLRTWTTKSILLQHPDQAKHGFQYVDWLFEGKDIIFISRTAWDDKAGGAHNYHDANYLTFHRVPDFRTRTMADSEPMPEWLPQRREFGDFVITGYNIEIGELTEGNKAFSNRGYVWLAVPDNLRNHAVTRPAGGARQRIMVTAKQDATLSIATGLPSPGTVLPGWKTTGASFRYSDGSKTALVVFNRTLRKGEEVALPQVHWTGTLVFLPDVSQPLGKE